MKSPANDNDTPSGQSAKTVCLDCGCEFQAAGSGRDQRECPICSEVKGHVEDPESLEWAQILRPKPTEPSNKQANGTPKTIEVEVTNTTNQALKASLPPPAATTAPVSPTGNRPHERPPATRPGPPPAPRTPESTGELLEDLRDIGFQITDDRPAEESGS